MTDVPALTHVDYDNGSLVVTGSTFMDNMASEGGDAILNGGKADLSQSGNTFGGDQDIVNENP